MSGLVLGVDGGGTKSHYALATAEGRLVDLVEGGAANHEVYDEGFPAAARELGSSIRRLLERNGASARELAASVFGIAGADVPSQAAAYRRVLAELGIGSPVVCNDAFLGVKAGTARGWGVCSINGTGTVAAAVDPAGRRIQIGGTGVISGDEAGAGHIALMAARRAYDALFRCGPPTALEGELLRFLGLGPGEEERFIEAIYERGLEAPATVLGLARAVFSCAASGDAEAIGILENAGAQMARSVAGAVRRLDFSGLPEVEVVVAGSVSLKGECPVLLDRFEAEARRLSPLPLAFLRLGAPPVLGALLWALEEAGGAPGRRDGLAAELGAALGRGHASADAPAGAPAFDPGTTA